MPLLAKPFPDGSFMKGFKVQFAVARHLFYPVFSGYETVFPPFVYASINMLIKNDRERSGREIIDAKGIKPL